LNKKYLFSKNINVLFPIKLPIYLSKIWFK